MNSKTVFHEFAPVYDKNSKVLILGSMPSPKSRENGFYYMHPQNRFWRVLSKILGEAVSQSISWKRELLLRNGIALWDVLGSCEICGANDSSIKNPVPNELSVIFSQAHINAVFTTGTKASMLYEKLCTVKYDALNIPHFSLPSTSPANCRIDFKALCDAYAEIRKYL